MRLRSEPEFGWPRAAIFMGARTGTRFFETTRNLDTQLVHNIYMSSFALCIPNVQKEPND